MKRRKRATFALGLAALALTLSGGGVATAAKLPGHVYTLPGATSLGYTPRIVVILKGSPLTYHNLDIAPHDVRSTAPGKFASPVITIGKTAKVIGVPALARGNYGFYCSIHTNMRGNLIVR